MTTAIEVLVNTVSLGGTYALLALGLAVVFSMMRLVNFAHGELMTITGYTMFFCLSAGLPWVALAGVGIGAAAIAAVLMERIAFRPFRDANPMTLLLTSLAISLLLQVLFQDFISARAKGVPVPDAISGSVQLGPINIGTIQLISATTSLAMLFLLTVFFRRAKLGISMRAAAEDFAVTRLMGVRANRVIAAAFALSGLLAGVAGVLWVAQRGTVDPLMGFTPVLKAFTAAIIGGLGSLTGAVAAGFLLGFFEVGLQTYLPQDALKYRDALVWVLVIAVLLWRPHGLFSPGAGERQWDLRRLWRQRSP